jgi:hypothetical protein
MKAEKLLGSIPSKFTRGLLVNLSELVSPSVFQAWNIGTFDILAIIVFAILVVIGLMILIFLVKILLLFIPAAIVAFIVWFLTDGNLWWAGVAFLVIAVIGIVRRL